MSMATELFGIGVLKLSLPELKALINKLPPAARERKSYIMNDWARLKRVELTENDYIEVGAPPRK